MLLLKSIHLIDSSSAHNGEEVDILIDDNGIIGKIGKNLAYENAQIVEEENLHVSIGWIDIGCEICDPGYEHRENIDSAIAAAAAGGFTAIACLPNTAPALHSKSEILYVKRQSADKAVECYPLGAISVDCNGHELTELYDMYNAGALAFTDGKNAVQNSGLMLRALQYVKAFDGLVMNHPADQSLMPGSAVHEGIVSTSLGLKGNPRLAEIIMARRDIELAKYTHSKVHIANISCAETVELIRQAKAEDLRVTASVPLFKPPLRSRKTTRIFDVQYKVLPPLREANDREALISGVVDNTIDYISSNHTPWDKEAKDREFLFAQTRHHQP